MLNGKILSGIKIPMQFFADPESDKEKKKPDEEKPEETGTPPAEDEKPASDDKQVDENGEGAEKAKPEKEEPDADEDGKDNKSDDKSDEKPPESPPKDEPKDPEQPVSDPKDEEILKLKIQIAAMQMGFKPECMEDAVILAESYVKNGTEKDIETALSAVMKKYSDWKADGGKPDGKKSGGFKVGADSSDKKENADDERLSKAFGIKKK